MIRVHIPRPKPTAVWSFYSPIFLAVLCLIGACGGGEVHERKTIAWVNGEKVYADELELRLSLQRGILSPKAFSSSLNKKDALEEEILDSLITEKIMLQRAREMNLSVQPEELEEKIKEIRKDYGQNFFHFLAASNVRYEDWREQIKKDLLLVKLVEADVNNRILVSEEEAKDFYDDHPDFCKEEARVRAWQIIVRDKDKADDIKKRLDAGEDFAKWAKEASIGPEAARGGDLGWITRQTMPEPLDHTLFSLQAGKISPVVKSAYGYHIFKVVETYRARVRDFPSCRRDISAMLRARKEEAAFASWLDALKARAVVKKEARNQRQKTTK
jgi:parvulin-like peptidyl-prolyl isomerase